MEGKCIRWIADRKFGFLVCDELEQNVFVHSSNIENASSLSLGDKVTFEVQETPKGKRAVHVRLV